MEKRLVSVVECAHLAWAIEKPPASGPKGDPTGRPLLPGWKGLPWPDQAAPQEHAKRAGGFRAGAYVHEPSGSIVIAYRGRDLSHALSDTGWQDLPELLLGLGLVLGQRGVDIDGDQRDWALRHYLGVTDWARAQGLDPARLVFTGHGLGAALAANMGVWLGRPATLFAAAPFNVTGGNGDGQPATVHVSVQGELLAYAREVMPIAVHADHHTVLDLGHPPVSEAVALHRMGLHLALLLDERLGAWARRLPELLPALRDGSGDPAQDLIVPLVEHQLRRGLDHPGALQRFLDDIERLSGLSVFDGCAGARRDLIRLLAHLHAQQAEPQTMAPDGSESGFLNGIEVKELAPDDPAYRLYDWGFTGPTGVQARMVCGPCLSCATPSATVLANRTFDTGNGPAAKRAPRVLPMADEGINASSGTEAETP